MLQIEAASSLQIVASVTANWCSYYKLGQLLLQNRTATTNWGKIYYKLGQVLQIRAIITNWGITTTSLNENLFWLCASLLIRMMLGWYLYISMTLPTRLSIFRTFWFMILEFPLIPDEETVFLKKVFNSSAIFLSSCSTSSFSTNFMLLLELPSFEKICLIVFQNNLLSLTKEGFS